MEKRGSVLAIIGIIVGILLLAGLGVGIYFYNFHVFKTLRVCISDDALNTNVTCSSNDFCLSSAKGNFSEFGNEQKIPDFLNEKINEVMESAIYCEQTCYIKNVRGLDKIGELESCNSYEKEIKIELHGKEVIELLDYMKQVSTN